MCPVGNRDFLMANAFEHHISHEQEQMSNGLTKAARVAARPFPGRDSVSAGAFTIPARSVDQKRLAGEVAWSVAERTAELAEANDETRREIGERRKLKSNLLENEAAEHLSLPSAADRAKARFPGSEQLSKRMLSGISPIGETSPAKDELSSKKSSAWNRAANC
jgi:hypothetical protein